MRTNSRLLNFATGISLLIGLLLVASIPGFGQRGSTETIDATAFGHKHTARKKLRSENHYLRVLESRGTETFWYRHSSRVRTTDW